MRRLRTRYRWTSSGLEKFASPDFVPLEQVGILAAGKAGG